ncbi:MAG: DUF2807 domain-containing protein [Prolixibacteraceae bacterium]|nr:DUF2807 domain-containing protein [Prolixibacteraceae bacterium]
MKTRIFLFALFLSGLFLQPFSAQAKKETKQLATFTAINLLVSATLNLTQGENQNIEVIANPETLEKLIIEVVNEKLIIRLSSTKNFFNNFNPGKIEIFVTAKHINQLSVSGSGKIIVKDGLNAQTIDMTVSGSGAIKLEKLSANTINTTVTGSGDIHLSGQSVADKLNAAVTGSGTLKANAMEARDVKVSITGSGKCYVNSNNNITAQTTGSGSIYYSGTANIDARSTGSGRIIRNE